MPWPFLILVAVFAILGATAWYGEQQRREELKAWCRRRGFGLKIARQSGLERDYPGLKLFSRGHGRFAQNTISGEWRGRRVKLMDYQYTTGSGKNRQTHKVGVVVIAADHPVIPLSIRRENPFDKVGEFLSLSMVQLRKTGQPLKGPVRAEDPFYLLIQSRRCYLNAVVPDTFPRVWMSMFTTLLGPVERAEEAARG